MDDGNFVLDGTDVTSMDVPDENSPIEEVWDVGLRKVVSTFSAICALTDAGNLIIFYENCQYTPRDCENIEFCNVYNYACSLV